MPGPEMLVDAPGAWVIAGQMVHRSSRRSPGASRRSQRNRTEPPLAVWSSEPVSIGPNAWAGSENAT